jgi:aspartyl-tRNA(Asn)/glutamyl-tRNA(Gln) amidotransferase subunit A
MDAVTLAEKIRTKQLSATEVTEAVLGRMDKLNPVLGAFCTPSPDVARAQAKAIDADIMAGKTVGPLAGVPVGIKDLVYTKGIRTTSGSIIYKDYVPTEDDVVVERLKAAGAIIIGKTNVPELGYSGASYNLIFPPTNNPWNTEHETQITDAVMAAEEMCQSGVAILPHLRSASDANDCVSAIQTGHGHPGAGDD